MKTTIWFLAVAALHTSLFALQQPSPQPMQTQEQAVPCVITPTSPNPSGPNTAVKVPNKLQQILNKQRQAIAAKTGITLPDVPNNIALPANSKPIPCPPQAGSPKNSQPTPSPMLKLPADTTVTLHCNPMSPSPKDSAGHQATLILPNPADFATPKPGDFLVDSVVPDLAAKTGCWQVKVDPLTKKSFIAQ